MQLQSEERTEKLEHEKEEARKPLGIVAVAPGSGNAKILESLGVDVVVSGGQTMNPSTADILAAVNKVNADAVSIPSQQQEHHHGIPGMRRRFGETLRRRGHQERSSGVLGAFRVSIRGRSSSPTSNP